MKRLELEWPGLSARLLRLLAKRGVPSWVAEDIVQETATRLVASWDKIDPARPLAPYACTIALNLLTDHYRRLSQADIRSELPDVAAGVDVPHEVFARLDIQEVASALKQISPPQRDALLADIAGEQKGVAPAPVRMLRLRARRALTRLVDRSAAVSAGLLVRLRRAEDLAKTYLPQVSVAVQARLLFGASQSLLAGMVAVGVLAGPGVNIAPERITTKGATVAATQKTSSAMLAETRLLRRDPDDRNPKTRVAKPAPLIDEIDHEAETERGYSFEVPGAATTGGVWLATLARVRTPGTATDVIGDRPSCSMTTSKHSVGVGCLHQGTLTVAVHLRNKNKTVFRPIN